ncbi:hypothetical protein K525DRAFT_259617 [Schizophyllum commune Loenen D]|nr:hypothetical protein K525DRAFT_259617 [Schizophyllum commune Loenen D]
MRVLDAASGSSALIQCAATQVGSHASYTLSAPVLRAASPPSGAADLSMAPASQSRAPQRRAQPPQIPPPPLSQAPQGARRGR